ncbi:MAG: YfcC family protein [Cetobacterium sp.]
MNNESNISLENQIEEIREQKSFKIEKFKIPHTYVIIAGMIILAFIGTYIIPAGVYQRVKDINTGRMIISPETFSFVQNTPVKFFSFTDKNLFTVLIRGLQATSGIVFFTFLVCGFFNMIQMTGAIDSGIAKVACKFKDKGLLLILVVMFVFSIGGVAIGMNTEAIAFVPLGVLLARALGFDAMVGMSMVALGAGVGFIGGFINPFTVGVAHSIAGLPIYSGIGFRVVVYIVLYIVTAAYIIRYAKKVKVDPLKSVVRDLELKQKSSSSDVKEIPDLTNRQKGVLFIMLIGFIGLTYGVLKHGWGTEQLISVFMFMGIASSIMGGVSATDSANNFLDGARGVVFGALAVGLARGILVVLEDGQIIDTILFYLSGKISSLPGVVSALLMYCVQIVTNIFIPSGSGQAATTMPIMAPLADMIGVSRQTVVLAFQYGDGFTNYINPTAGGLMSYLAISQISYEKWVKWMGPLMGIWMSIGAIAIVVAYFTGY